MRGAERQVIGVLTVPNWQPGMGPQVLPRVYRDILEVVSDASGPVRAKQIVPRIGLPAETGKIEGTRSKLKRLVERGWLDEDTPGMFTLRPSRSSPTPSARPKPASRSTCARGSSWSTALATSLT